jgi:hypothetical protein
VASSVSAADPCSRPSESGECVVANVRISLVTEPSSQRLIAASAVGGAIFRPSRSSCGPEAIARGAFTVIICGSAALLDSYRSLLKSIIGPEGLRSFPGPTMRRRGDQGNSLLRHDGVYF